MSHPGFKKVHRLHLSKNRGQKQPIEFELSDNGGRIREVEGVFTAHFSIFVGGRVRRLKIVADSVRNIRFLQVCQDFTGLSMAFMR